MATEFTTEQEAFWAGDFGDAYADRNRGSHLLASNVHFFARALAAASRISSCLELGANIGMNLLALRTLYPDLDVNAVEINDAAADELDARFGADHVHRGSILDFATDRTFDLVLIKGVLIHLSPDHLDDVYRTLVTTSHRYVLVCEYYNPVPVAVPYRGHMDRLFKRDFAGEILDRFDDVELVDYGFAYHRDPVHPQDDISWFLLRRLQ